MARRDIKQASIAAALGVTQQAVSGKLAGRRPFNDREITVIAGVLGVPAGVLFEEHESMRSGGAA